MANVTAVHGENLHINFARSCERHGVDGGINLVEELRPNGIASSAHFAGEIPEIGPGGHGFAAFAFHVFAHVMLDAVDYALRIEAGHTERKGLFHLKKDQPTRGNVA